MTYKIAVCDDCAADSRYLTTLGTNWGKLSGNQVIIREFSSAESFLFHYETENDFDILLLDIEMGECNGVELARKIRSNNAAVQIIFITGFPDFMAEGYEVSALHYLMKPVSADRINSVLDRAAATLAKTEKRLKIVFDHQVSFVPFSQILYIEAQKQYVLIHTRNGLYRMKDSLTDIQTRLDEHFYKCQRSFLVNLSHVTRIRHNCIILNNDEEIPISRGAAEAIGKAIIALF